MPKRTPIPRRVVLNRLFKYHEDGKLLVRRHVNNSPRKIGEEVGYLDKGYLKARIGNTNYAVHRIIWKIHYDTEPEYVDHINGDKLDNRIQNLRAATNAENMMNKPSKGTYRGVYRIPSGNFTASFSLEGTTINLGTFTDEVSAAKAYDEAVRSAVKAGSAPFLTLNFPTEIEELL